MQHGKINKQWLSKFYDTQYGYRALPIDKTIDIVLSDPKVEENDDGGKIPAVVPRKNVNFCRGIFALSWVGGLDAQLNTIVCCILISRESRKAV